ncbi:hypothetical protein LY04_03554 [Oceanimonas baumannii]|uniref:Uncharacterized protein n=1 Tax=Oceanimonas baumannii TaxID=129578 RepID=A0ABY2EU55_9GAMM|nr:hypothetical protein LY04_03554 [Oceanimonas baumannii]
MSYYTHTAYRSDKIPDLPPAPAGNSSFWAQMGLRAGPAGHRPAAAP